MENTFGSWAKEVGANIIEISRKDAIQTSPTGNRYAILDVKVDHGIKVAYLGLLDSANRVIEIRMQVETPNWKSIISVSEFSELMRG